MHEIRKALGSSRAIGLIVVSVMLAAACGSTVSQEKFRTSGQAGGGGLGIGSGPSGLEPTTGGSPAAGPAGSLGGTTGGGLGGPGAGPTVPAALAPGVTDTTLYFGGYYNTNQGAANAALGAGGIDQGDARDPYNAMIEEINKAGGLAGRKVVPVYYGYNATSTQTADQQDQAACAQWTEDHKVFVINVSGPILDECAKKAGTLEFGGNGSANRALPETYQQYPHRIDIGSFEMVKAGTVTIDGLADHGYFTRGAKIGFVTWDDPMYREGLSRGYSTPLRNLGLSEAIQPAYISPPEAYQELGQTTAAVSGAVLKFHTQGIDHVIIQDGPAGVCGGFCLTLEWVQEANSQHYYPIYGFNETNSPKAAVDEELLPTRALRGAIAVTWVDLDDSYDVGWHTNAARERCYAIMRKHGITPDNVNAFGAALGACSELWFLQRVVNSVVGPLTVDAVIAQVNRVGFSFQDPASYFNYFGPTRHAGAAGVRYMHFVDSCSCYRYIGGAYKV